MTDLEPRHSSLGNQSSNVQKLTARSPSVQKSTLVSKMDSINAEANTLWNTICGINGKLHEQADNLQANVTTIIQQHEYEYL